MSSYLASLLDILRCCICELFSTTEAKLPHLNTTDWFQSPRLNFASTVLIFSIGASPSNQVHQTPPEMVVAIGSEAMVTLNCSHSIVNYNQFFWYKQRSNKQLELLGNLYVTNENLEKGIMDVAMSGNAEPNKTAELRIKNIRVESSAVYFCAASFHNAAY